MSRKPGRRIKPCKNQPSNTDYSLTAHHSITIHRQRATTHLAASKHDKESDCVQYTPFTSNGESSCIPKQYTKIGKSQLYLQQSVSPVPSSTSLLRYSTVLFMSSLWSANPPPLTCVLMTDPSLTHAMSITNTCTLGLLLRHVDQ